MVMPYISMFFGIIIRMFYKEHSPPHFHADYQGQRASFDFDGKLIKGGLESKTARRLIRKWAQIHRKELEENWGNIKKGKQLNKIAPLD
jgi:hypothetical protein